ncbi:iron uptake system protein EfeO [Parafrigoribacterium soli]|uniref:iron uptake system protein EfeO n=1 Tax=Parafrigoribacterium soli TaxID=3144663 RepID=UPI0032EE0510
MIKRTTRLGLLAVAGAATLLALTACVPNAGTESKTSASTRVSVDSSATACTVSANTAPSGPVVFSVTNSADKVTEFYVLGEDGLRIVGELENITPGVKRSLTVRLQPGTYFTECKPGMAGSGVGRSKFTVTESGKAMQLSGDIHTQTSRAAQNYVAYVQGQVEDLVPATAAFLTAYRAGDDERARALYATTRAFYERIEPVAESFGDLDPEIDFREADVPQGEEWTGFHRIEKDLWPPANAGYVALTAAQRGYYSDKLSENIAELSTKVNAEDYSVSIETISNGAIGLLDEVATGKITGEEEIWSHTDLWDFQANLDGARVAYEGVRDIVRGKNSALVKNIDEKFGALEQQLAGYGSLDAGFTYYDELTPTQVKALANGVNALSEPLSRLTAALVK